MHPSTHSTRSTRRHRRFSHVRRLIRRRWADYVVVVALTFACLIALFLLLDVIDNTIAKPDRLIPSERPSRTR
jgi:hypothetical protein